MNNETGMRKWRVATRMVVAAVAVVCLVAIFGCKLLGGDASDGDPVVPAPLSELGLPAKPETLPAPLLFSATSPFNSPIPPNPEIDPDSDNFLSLMRTSASQGPVLALDAWSVPVYFPQPTTPRLDVPLTADWAPARLMKGVPLPSFALPDPEEDAHLVVLDLENMIEYDFWGFRRAGDGSVSAAWGNALSLDGPGVYPTGFSARGSGLALLGGVIWPQELESGRIGHALIFSYDFCRAGGPVPPATESDGDIEEAWALPEGARVQLDPALDIDGLGLTPVEATIARAMQEYGLYLADSGGGFTLYGINPLSVTRQPYSGLAREDYEPFKQATGEGGYLQLTGLRDRVFNRLRVLKLPPQTGMEPILDRNGVAVFE